MLTDRVTGRDWEKVTVKLLLVHRPDGQFIEPTACTPRFMARNSCQLRYRSRPKKSWTKFTLLLTLDKKSPLKRVLSTSGGKLAALNGNQFICS